MSDTKRNFDKDASSWDENPGRVKLVQDIADTIVREINLTPSMDVLDFGCGTGLLTFRLQPFVHSITGVDSSHGMLDVLNSKIKEQNLANIKTSFLDIEKEGVIKGSYNLITSSMTFHHIRNVGHILNQLYNALLPDGHICIADLDSDDGQFHESNEGVFHFGFDRKNLSNIMKKSGFQNIKCTTAAKITKAVHGGRNREFTIFLIIGYKEK